MRSSTSTAFWLLASFGISTIEAWVPQLLRRQTLSSRQFRVHSLSDSSSVASSILSDTPRISSKHLQELADKKYVVIRDFISADLQQDLREDVYNLREADKFAIAKIGQDSTNTLNKSIRVAETCFLGNEKPPEVPTPARQQLYHVLDQLRRDLSENPILDSPPLDENLSELLYAYYPEGGFYRRHRDAIPGSASVLRTYSLLLYLNKDWDKADGGQLRLHFDSGGDELPEGEQPKFIDVLPYGGTLVLFQSDAIPHEVLDTQKERMAVVGWYNRPVRVTDIADLSEGGGGLSPTRGILLAIAAALVAIGVEIILSS